MKAIPQGINGYKLAELVTVWRKKFEAALARLEEIVQELEKGDLPLEQSLKLFEEGIKLSRICNSRLEEAERKVEILLKDRTVRSRQSRLKKKESRTFNFIP
jgi:exodeoxyribonuclease VII small subunit